MGVLQARILEWVAMASSRRSSQPRDLTQVSCIADGFFTIWSTKEALILPVKSLQSCPTLCDPKDGSPPGSPVPGILQARTLEWVAISLSNVWKKSESEVAQSCPTLSDPMDQVPPSVGFSRQEYWSGVPLLQVTCTLICFLGVPEAALQAEALGRALLQQAPHASPADLQTLGKGHVLLQAACVLHEFLVGTP